VKADLANSRNPANVAGDPAPKSGVFFALSGYLHALTGAVLSWAASVLDGCDGEVARLTHQESDPFGAHMVWIVTLYSNRFFRQESAALGFARRNGR
jgi:hypothetical protein